jgi:SEC-C motif-containing protein
MAAPLKPGAPCPCGLPQTYERCCGRWHAGEPAPDAERLMRSRYAAYALGLGDYLLATWQAGTRPETLDVATPPQPKWIGLDVRRHEPAGDTAIVEFTARYRVGGRAHKLHETSRFVREDGRWYYVDGDLADPA